METLNPRARNEKRKPTFEGPSTSNNSWMNERLGEPVKEVVLTHNFYRTVMVKR
jgi:hypothetical protein